MSFPVRLAAAYPWDVSVGYATANGSATEWEDYVPVSGTLTIPAGQTGSDIGVILLDDTVYEGDEFFAVVLSNSRYATHRDGQGRGTIHEDESPPDIAFSSGHFNALEAGGTATIEITLSGDTVLPATVEYATQDGTAIDGQDYESTSGTLIFSSGITSRTLSVKILEDAIAEEDETVSLCLSNPKDAEIVPPACVTLTITDNDTTLELAILSPPYAMWSKPLEEGPRVFVVQVAVTNTGKITADDVGLALDYNDDSDWWLLPDEMPDRPSRDLHPGEPYYGYWSTTYSITPSVSHTYAITAKAINGAPIVTYTTVLTERAQGTGSTRLTQKSGHAGEFLLVTASWNLGTKPEEVVFSPVGNDSFKPAFYRLVSATVAFTTPTGIVTISDRLYFEPDSSPVPLDAEEARAEFYFRPIQPLPPAGIVQFCPYAALRQGNEAKFKYDNRYCDPPLVVTPTPTPTTVVTATVQGPVVLVAITDRAGPSSLVRMRFWFLGLAVLSLWGAFRLVHGLGNRCPRNRAAPGSRGPSSGVGPDE